MSNSVPRFWEFLFEKPTVTRALKVALVVGTLLILVNQGDLILAGTMPPVWKILLTYCVPYAVSSYSSAAMMRDVAQVEMVLENQGEGER